MRKLTALTILLASLAFLLSCQPKPVEQAVESAMPDMLKGNVEPYYFSKTLTGEFDTIVEQVRMALKSEGFGVISTIDIQKSLKEKLDVDFRKYMILGACNPPFAYKALQAEDKIGTMLPCNVVIQEVGENTYEVAAVNPIASMMAIDNEELGSIAIEVKEKLKMVVDKLE